MRLVNIIDVVKIANRSVDRFNGVKKYIETGDLSENIIRTYTDVTYDNRPSRANVEVETGQVIFARMKDTKKVILIDDVNVDFIYSTGFCVFEPSKAILSDYLKIILNSDLFQNQKDKYSTGATQKAINNAGLKKIQIPLPTLEIQRKIVEVMDKTQGLSDARKEQIKLMDELIEVVFYEMFSKNEIYPTKSIKEVCVAIYDCPHSTPKYSDAKTLYRCLRTSNLGNGYIDWGNLVYVEENIYHERNKRYTPSIGDVVYSREGAILGIAAIVNKDEFMCLGQRLMIFTLDNEHVNSTFFWMMLNSHFVRRQVELNIGGAAAPRINIKDIKKFEIFLPPIELQNKFAVIIDKIEEMKNQIQISENEIRKNNNSLTHKIFKGELFASV